MYGTGEPSCPRVDNKAETSFSEADALRGPYVADGTELMGLLFAGDGDG